MLAKVSCMRSPIISCMGADSIYNRPLSAQDAEFGELAGFVKFMRPLWTAGTLSRLALPFLHNKMPCD